MLEKVVAKTHQIQSKNSNFRREMDKRHSNVCSPKPLRDVPDISIDIPDISEDVPGHIGPRHLN